jgi:hypothetical protein
LPLIGLLPYLILATIVQACCFFKRFFTIAIGAIDADHCAICIRRIGDELSICPTWRFLNTYIHMTVDGISEIINPGRVVDGLYAVKRLYKIVNNASQKV